MYHFNTSLGSTKLNRLDTLLTINKDVSIIMVTADQAKSSKKNEYFIFKMKKSDLNFTKMLFSTKKSCHIGRVS